MHTNHGHSHHSLPAGLRQPAYDGVGRGVEVTGATAHYVTEELDARPIISRTSRE